MKPSIKEQLKALKPELDKMIVARPKMDGTGPNPDCPLKKTGPAQSVEVEKDLTSAGGEGEALIPENGKKSRKMTKVIDALDAVAKSLYALEKNVMRGE